jgi:hypothetical protein
MKGFLRAANSTDRQRSVVCALRFEGSMWLAPIERDGELRTMKTKLLSAVSGSMRMKKSRRAVLALTISLPAFLGISVIGASQASATTTTVSTSYHGSCLYGQWGSQVVCLPSRLTSTGVPQFKAKFLSDSNATNCFANYASVKMNGYWLDAGFWVYNSGGPYTLTSGSEGSTFSFGFVASGYEEQIGVNYCTLDFQATY